MKNKTLLKILSFGLLVAFGLQDLAWAEGASRPIYLSKTLASSSRGSEGRLDWKVIHIQDAHDSLEAQQKISGILETLVSEYDIRSVALEGSGGDIDPSLFKTYPDKEWAERSAGKLVEEGKLNAGEFFAITSKKSVSVYGVEERTLYRENLKAFRDLLLNKEKIDHDLKGLTKTLEVLSDRIYSDKIKWIRAHSLFSDTSNLSFPKKWEAFESLAREKNIDLNSYPSLKLLAGAAAFENRIDFKRANQEREELFSSLKNSLKGKELETLLQRSVRFKAGEISDLEFYQFLSALTQVSKSNSGRYPNLIAYIEYLQYFDSIDLADVLKEFEIFEARLKAEFFISEDERILDRLETESLLVTRVLSGSATSTEFDRFKKEITRARFTALKKECSDLTVKYSVPLYEGFEFQSLESSFPKAMRFYTLAKKRDAVLLQNTLKRMRKDGQRVAALVTGGFHGEGITELLKKNELSYLVVLPNVEDASKKRPYMTILTRRRGQYEKELSDPASRYKVVLGTGLDTALANPYARVEEVLQPLAEGLKAAGQNAGARLAKWMDDYEKDFRNSKIKDRRNPALEPRNVRKSLEKMIGRHGEKRPEASRGARLAEASDFIADNKINFDPRFNYRILKLAEKDPKDWTEDEQQEYEALQKEIKEAHDWTRQEISRYPSLIGHPPALLSLEGIVSAVERGKGPRLTSYHGGLGVLFGEWIRGIAYLGGVTTLEADSKAPEFNIFIPDYEKGVTTSRVHAFGYPILGARQIQRPQDHGIDFMKDPKDPSQPFQIEIPLFESGELVYVRFRTVKIGALKLIMPVMDFDKNHWAVQHIFEELYKGKPSSRERFEQEWVAGLAAFEFRKKMGIPLDGPVHLNETATFPYLIGLIRYYMEEGYSYEDSLKLVGSQLVFFTHTLVAAGIDHFHEDGVKMGHYIRSYFERSSSEEVRKQAGNVARDMIHGKRSEDGKLYLPGFEGSHGHHVYSPLHFVVRLAHSYNGTVVAVSQLNAIEAGKFFIQQGIITPEENAKKPVLGITNGVDHLFWMIREVKEVMNWQESEPEKRTPERILDPDDPEAKRLAGLFDRTRQFESIGEAPFLADETLFETLYENKKLAIEMVRNTVHEQYIRETGEIEKKISENHVTPEDLERLHVMRTRWARWIGKENPEEWVKSWEGRPFEEQGPFRKEQHEGTLKNLMDPDLFLGVWARRIVNYKRILFEIFGHFLPEVEAQLPADKALSHKELDDIILRLKNKGALNQFVELVVKKKAQFIFAGKAFSEDGRSSVALIHRVIEILSKDNPEIQDRVLFLEGYDETKSQYLVRGADTWINTPKRPLEASGTSGMKVAKGDIYSSPNGDGWGAGGIEDKLNGRVKGIVGTHQDHPDTWPQAERENASNVSYYLGQEAAHFNEMMSEEIDRYNKAMAYFLKKDEAQRFNAVEWLQQIRRWMYFTALVYDIRGEFTGRRVPSFRPEDVPGGDERGIFSLYEEAIARTQALKKSIADEKNKQSLPSEAPAKEGARLAGLYENPILDEINQEKALYNVPDNTKKLVDQVRELIPDHGKVTRLIYPASLYDAATVASLLSVFPNVREVFLVDFFGAMEYDLQQAKNEKEEKLREWIESKRKEAQTLWAGNVKHLVNVFEIKTQNPDVRVILNDYYDVTEISKSKPDGLTVVIDKFPGYNAKMRGQAEYRRSIMRDTKPGDLIFSVKGGHYDISKWTEQPLGTDLSLPYLWDWQKKWMVSRLSESDFKISGLSSEASAKEGARLADHRGNRGSVQGQVGRALQEAKEHFDHAIHLTITRNTMKGSALETMLRKYYNSETLRFGTSWFDTFYPVMWKDTFTDLYLELSKPEPDYFAIYTFLSATIAKTTPFMIFADESTPKDLGMATEAVRAGFLKSWRDGETKMSEALESLKQVVPADDRMPLSSGAGRVEDDLREAAGLVRRMMRFYIQKAWEKEPGQGEAILESIQDLNIAGAAPVPGKPRENFVIDLLMTIKRIENIEEILTEYSNERAVSTEAAETIDDLLKNRIKPLRDQVQKLGNSQPEFKDFSMLYFALLSLHAQGATQRLTDAAQKLREGDEKVSAGARLAANDPRLENIRAGIDYFEKDMDSILEDLRSGQQTADWKKAAQGLKDHLGKAKHALEARNNVEVWKNLSDAWAQFDKIPGEEFLSTEYAVRRHQFEELFLLWAKTVDPVYAYYLMAAFAIRELNHVESQVERNGAFVSPSFVIRQIEGLGRRLKKIQGMVLQVLSAENHHAVPSPDIEAALRSVEKEIKTLEVSGQKTVRTVYANDRNKIFENSKLDDPSTPLTTSFYRLIQEMKTYSESRPKGARLASESSKEVDALLARLLVTAGNIRNSKNDETRAKLALEFLDSVPFKITTVVHAELERALEREGVKTAPYREALEVVQSVFSKMKPEDRTRTLHEVVKAADSTRGNIILGLFRPIRENLSGARLATKTSASRLATLNDLTGGVISRVLYTFHIWNMNQVLESVWSGHEQNGFIRKTPSEGDLRKRVGPYTIGQIDMSAKYRGTLKEISLKDFTEFLKLHGFKTPFLILRSMVRNIMSHLSPPLTRQCPLCEANFPLSESAFHWKGNYRWNITPNPFPILDSPQDRHFVIGAADHTPQVLDEKAIRDMIRLAREAKNYRIFFNGIGAGASIPRHRHIQAVTYAFPIENEFYFPLEAVKDEGEVTTFKVKNYPRELYAFQSQNETALAHELYEKIFILQNNQIPHDLLLIRQDYGPVRAYLFALNPKRRYGFSGAHQAAGYIFSPAKNAAGEPIDLYDHLNPDNYSGKPEEKEAQALENIRGYLKDALHPIEMWELLEAPVEGARLAAALESQAQETTIHIERSGKEPIKVRIQKKVDPASIWSEAAHLVISIDREGADLISVNFDRPLNESLGALTDLIKRYILENDLPLALRMTSESEEAIHATLNRELDTIEDLYTIERDPRGVNYEQVNYFVDEFYRLLEGRIFHNHSPSDEQEKTIRKELREILEESIKNAFESIQVRFMHEDETLYKNTPAEDKPIQKGEIHVYLVPHGEELMFQVIDDGMGVHPQVLKLTENESENREDDREWLGGWFERWTNYTQSTIKQEHPEQFLKLSGQGQGLMMIEHFSHDKMIRGTWTLKDRSKELKDKTGAIFTYHFNFHDKVEKKNGGARLAEYKPKAIIFDFDGTLVNTLPYQEKAFGAVYHWITTAKAQDPKNEADLKNGIAYLHDTMGDLITEQIAGMIERSLKLGHTPSQLHSVYKALAKRFDIPMPAEPKNEELASGFSKVFEAYLLDQMNQALEAQKLDLLPGVLDFLEALKKSGITLYIGTGTFRSVAQKVTERLGVRGYFKEVYGAVISAGPKEFPNGKVDMLRKVKNDLPGILWHDELMIVGDGHGDVRASWDGDDKFVAVGLSGADPKAAAHLRQAGADYIVPSLKDWRSHWAGFGFADLGPQGARLAKTKNDPAALDKITASFSEAIDHLLRSPSLKKVSLESILLYEDEKIVDLIPAPRRNEAREELKKRIKVVLIAKSFEPTDDPDIYNLPASALKKIFNTEKRGARLAGTQSMAQSLRRTYLTMQDSFQNELKAAAPTAEVIVVTAYDERMKKLYERHLENLRGITYRKDVPVLVVTNPVFGNKVWSAGSGGMIARSLRAVDDAFLSLKEKYPHLRSKKSLEDLNILIVQGGGLGERMLFSSVLGSKTLTPLPLTLENGSQATLLDLAMMAGPSYTQALVKKGWPGVVTLAGDIVSITKPQIKDGLNLLGAPKTPAEIDRRLGVIAQNGDGHVYFIEKPSLDQMAMEPLLKNHRYLLANAANSVLTDSDPASYRRALDMFLGLEVMMRKELETGGSLFPVDTSIDLLEPRAASSMDEALQRREGDDYERKDFYTSIYKMVREGLPALVVPRQSPLSSYFIDFASVSDWFEVLKPESVLSQVLGRSFISSDHAALHKITPARNHTRWKYLLFGIGQSMAYVSDDHAMLKVPIKTPHGNGTAVVYVDLKDKLEKVVEKGVLFGLPASQVLKNLGIPFKPYDSLLDVPMWPVISESSLGHLAAIQGLAKGRPSNLYINSPKMSVREIQRSINMDTLERPIQGARLAKFFDLRIEKISQSNEQKKSNVETFRVRASFDGEDRNRLSVKIDRPFFVRNWDRELQYFGEIHDTVNAFLKVSYNDLHHHYTPMQHMERLRDAMTVPTTDIEKLKKLYPKDPSPKRSFEYVSVEVASEDPDNGVAHLLVSFKKRNTNEYSTVEIARPLGLMPFKYEDVRKAVTWMLDEHDYVSEREAAKAIESAFSMPLFGARLAEAEDLVRSRWVDEVTVKREGAVMQEFPDDAQIFKKITERLKVLENDTPDNDVEALELGELDARMATLRALKSELRAFISRAQGPEKKDAEIFLAETARLQKETESQRSKLYFSRFSGEEQRLIAAVGLAAVGREDLAEQALLADAIPRLTPSTVRSFLSLEGITFLNSEKAQKLFGRYDINLSDKNYLDDRFFGKDYIPALKELRANAEKRKLLKEFARRVEVGDRIQMNGQGAFRVERITKGYVLYYPGRETDEVQEIIKRSELESDIASGRYSLLPKGARLAESAEWDRSVLENAPPMFAKLYRKDDTGAWKAKFVHVSPAFLRTWPEDKQISFLQGEPFDDFTLYDYDLAKQYYQDDIKLYDLFKSGHDIQSMYPKIESHLSADGKITSVLVDKKVVTYSNGSFRIFGSFIDVTKEMEADKKLRRSEAHLRQALSAAGMVAWVWDMDRDIVHWSDGADLFFKTSQRNLPQTSRDVQARVHPQDQQKVQDAIRTALIEKRAYRFQFRMRMDDGQTYWIESYPGVFSKEEGTSIVTGVFMDVTQRKHADMQLLQTEKLAALGELAAVVGHELGNSLFRILGNIRLARQANPTDQALAAVEQEAERSANIAKSLLALSKPPQTEMSPVDLVSVVEAVSILQEKLLKAKSIELKRSYTANLPPIMGDNGQLMMMLLNLVMNAEHATPTGGTILIRVYPSLDPGKVVLSVRDTGHGMSPEVRSKIFDPYFTTKSKGTGLGLPTVAKIVKQHDGLIEVRSEIERGTEFIVTFPVKTVIVTAPDPGEKKIEETPKIIPASAPKFKQILFVEDEEFNHSLLKRVIPDVFGVTPESVFGAYGAKEALAIYRAHPDINFIVLDYMMPVINGLQAAKILREEAQNSLAPRELVISFLSGSGRTDEMDKLIKAGIAQDAWFKTDVAIPERREVIKKIIQKLASTHLSSGARLAVSSYNKKQLEKILSEKSTKFLSPDETVNIFKAYNDPKYPNKKRIEEAVLERYWYYILNVANGMSTSPEESMDNAQEGYFGFRRALEKFEWERGIAFSTYLKWWVHQAIRRSKMQNRYQMRIPVHAHTLLAKIKTAIEEEIKNTTKEPTSARISELTGIPEKEVIRVRMAAKSAAFPTGKTESFEWENLAQWLGDSKTATPDWRIRLQEEEAEKGRLLRLIQELEPQRRLITKLRNGIGTQNGKQYTLREISDVLGSARENGLTRERVRQLEVAAIERLRERVSSEGYLEPVLTVDHTEVYLFEALALSPRHNDYELFYDLGQTELQRRIEVLKSKKTDLDEIRRDPYVLLSVETKEGAQGARLAVPTAQAKIVGGLPAFQIQASSSENPVLVGVRSSSVGLEIQKIFSNRKDVEIIYLHPHSAPQETLRQLDVIASSQNSPFSILIDDEDLNEKAKVEFLRQFHQLELQARPVLRDLLSGSVEMSSLSEDQKRTLVEDLSKILPSIAPRSWSSAVLKTLSVEEIWMNTKLELFHPSFGTLIEELPGFADKSPRAAIWSLETILKDPLILKTLEDRDRKLAGRMRIDDYLLTDTLDEVVLEKRFTDIFGARGAVIFKARFAGRLIRSTQAGNVSAVAKKLQVEKGYKPEYVLFVDSDEKRFVLRSKGDKTYQVLYLHGEYALTLDKVATQILAAGAGAKYLFIKGLQMDKDGNFIFSPILPIDFERQFKDFYQSLKQILQAA